MAELQDMRSRMRDTGYQAAPSRGGGNLGFWFVAAGAAVVGFAVVLFAPQFYSVQRTAALPVSQSVPAKVDGIGGNPVTAPQLPLPGDPARYAGKSPEEMAAMADAVCTQHGRASRVLSLADPLGEARKPKAQADKALDAFAHGANLTDENERLHCLLTEAPARYCSASQRSKIAANVINYFKAIEYKNVAIGVAARVAAIAPEVLRSSHNPAPAATPGTLLVDPRVIEGVEKLLRAGYLLKPQREDIGANVPREIKERFARVIGNASPCPQPPWWALWK
jgi:hypothetical protein